jgi:anti-sigma factor RsiW
MSVHVDDDTLVLHATGDADDAVAVEAHLATCAECRERRAEIGGVMAAARPEVADPGPDFEARTWTRLQPALGPRRMRTWKAPGAWVALAASLAVAFLLGRQFPEIPAPAPSPASAALGEAARERILLAAVEEHLERSQRVLVAASHADEPGELEPTRAVAADLVRDNRLYRQTALRNGEARLVDVLDELERLLVDLSKAPGDAPSEDAKVLQKRVDDVLFKVRVLGTRLRDRESPRPARMRPATS